jgi:hypothetical protein
MPLEAGKGQAAFKHNVATEVQAGKPAKQAVAIAYSEKERTGDMAEGYGPIKGTVSSVAELNLANQRLYGQLEGETTFENTGDASPSHEAAANEIKKLGWKFGVSPSSGYEVYGENGKPIATSTTSLEEALRKAKVKTGK